MILADSGFWIALANRRDPAHRAAVAALASYGDEGFISTWPVLTEASHLISARIGIDGMLKFVEQVGDGAAEIFPIDTDGLIRMHALMQKYRDLPMDLADASLVLAAEALGDGRILSTDTRDFGAYRFKNHKPFRNLLAVD